MSAFRHLSAEIAMEAVILIDRYFDKCRFEENS
jgi:hypothetical protein